MRSARRSPSRPSLRLLATLAAVLPAVATSSAYAQVGLSSVRAQSFANEDLLFFEPEFSDLFGFAFASGDFNGDGYPDLATSLPYDNGLTGGGLENTGAVVVRWGGPFGLVTGLADTFLSQYASGSQSPPETDDLYGYALAAGDFNGDGYADLAVGAPGDRVDCLGELHPTGSVSIHYGTPGGIQLAAEHWVTENSPGLGYCFLSGELFGRALAAGDFNLDGWGDLAIGVPFSLVQDSSSTWHWAGRVFVLYGHFGGVFPLEWQMVHQEVDGVQGIAEDGDEFGAALAVGDFNRDYFDDLAVGAPGENGSGAVQIFVGGSSGFDWTQNALWTQDLLLGAGASENGDEFGQALVGGDFDYDGYDDLAMGAPSEDIGASANTGMVLLSYGSPNALAPARVKELSQSSIFGLPSYDGPGDNFGHSLATGDFDADGGSDLAIGIPLEAAGGFARGGVAVLAKFNVAGNYSRYRFLSPGFSGIPPGVQNSAGAGLSLGLGDFDDDGHDDLVIGMPYWSEPEIQAAGRYTVLYGALFADGFDSGSTFDWSLTNP